MLISTYVASWGNGEDIQCSPQIFKLCCSALQSVHPHIATLKTCESFQPSSHFTEETEAQNKELTDFLTSPIGEVIDSEFKAMLHDSQTSAPSGQRTMYACVCMCVCNREGGGHIAENTLASLVCDLRLEKTGSVTIHRFYFSRDTLHKGSVARIKGIVKFL